MNKHETPLKEIRRANVVDEGDRDEGETKPEERWRGEEREGEPKKHKNNEEGVRGGNTDQGDKRKRKRK